MAAAAFRRIRCGANQKAPRGDGYSPHVAAVSFKRKYIAVAVIAAVALSLAVGFIMVLENRAQHAALLDSAAADARQRVASELGLRAAELYHRFNTGGGGGLDFSAIITDIRARSNAEDNQ